MDLLHIINSLFCWRFVQVIFTVAHRYNLVLLSYCKVECSTRIDKRPYATLYMLMVYMLQEQVQ